MLLPLLFPDAELIVVEFLRTRLTGVPVHVRVPHENTGRFVQVRRSGGLAETVYDRPRIDVNAWADSDEDAKDLAQLARAHLGDIRGTRSGHMVAGVTDFAGLAPVPDQSGQPRWFFSVEITVRGSSL